MAEEPGGRDDSAGSEADPLRLVLHTMEEQLDDRVDAVSDTGPSHDESTSDLIKLEETLSSAQDKAKQLVTLRLKLDEEEAQSAQPGAEHAGGQAGDGGTSSGAESAPGAAQASRAATARGAETSPKRETAPGSNAAPGEAHPSPSPDDPTVPA